MPNARSDVPLPHQDKTHRITQGVRFVWPSPEKGHPFTMQRFIHPYGSAITHYCLLSWPPGGCYAGPSGMVRRKRVRRLHPVLCWVSELVAASGSRQKTQRDTREQSSRVGDMNGQTIRSLLREWSHAVCVSTARPACHMLSRSTCARTLGPASVQDCAPAGWSRPDRGAGKSPSPRGAWRAGRSRTPTARL